MKQIRRHLTYANVMSSFAVFLILGGATAFAAVQKIGANEIKANSIKTGKIVKEAVTAGKIKNSAVIEAKIANGAVTTDKLANNAVTSVKIAKDAVTTEKILNDAVTNAKIGTDAVSTGKIANGAVTNTKLAAGAVHAGNLGTITIRTNTTSVAAETTGSLTVSCQAGEKMLGGGGGFNIVTAAPHPQVVTSQSSGAGTWLVRVFNPANFSRTLTVQAICLNV